MRKRQTFLLTILSSETGDASFCGRLKVISSGKSFTFSSRDELYALILDEMSGELQQQLSDLAADKRLATKPLSSS